MTKMRLVIMTIILAMLLSSCASLDDILKQQIEDQARLKDDPDYQKYLTYYENDKADEEGNYIFHYEENVETDSTSVNHPGSIHVTFGNNSHLSVHYYYDQKLTERADETKCYLNPGESLFADYSISEEASLLNFCFDRFQVFEIKDSERVLFGESDGADNLVVTIPESFDGEELCILPLWRPEDRGLSFQLCLINENGRIAQNDIGRWMVNDEFIKEDRFTISAAESYKVNEIIMHLFLNVRDRCFYLIGL